MRAAWETWLHRWLKVGLLHEATAERIRTSEASGAEEQEPRWPILVAVSLDGLMLSAGVLVLVAAHWDDLSPAAGFTLVLLVAIFHLAGAFLALPFAVPTTVLHALGAASLRANVFLTGQIFHLQEHWPGDLMLGGVDASGRRECLLPVEESGKFYIFSYAYVPAQAPSRFSLVW